VGDTGIGKTLFLYVYECLWLKENQVGPVVLANCAHFGGPGSDPNVARSELFGYDVTLIGKSSKTGKGLIDKANNGLLILEEIGELPPVVQAMLLTFIEDGKYRPFGTTIDKEAIVKIVGSTNREGALRDDFRYRFFPFYVPPLHIRRKDILYYFTALDPDIVRALTAWEILVLLGYNWPGGVREVKRVLRLLERTRELIDVDKIDPDDYYPSDRLRLIDKMDTALDAMQAMTLFEDLKSNGIDVEQMESILSEHGVGLNYMSNRYPFLTYNPSEIVQEPREEMFQMKSMKPYHPFDQAYVGYLFFCFLFFQDPLGNSNVFKMGPPTDTDWAGYFFYDRFSEKKEKAFQKLRVQAFEFRSGIKLSKGQQIPMGDYARQAFFKDLADAHPDNSFLAHITGRKITKEISTRKELDIYSMPFKEFMAHYHKELIERYGGNVAEAARKTQVEYPTLQHRLERYGVK
jgi:transcriptional regulator with PAS, ATPase and Fis domain